MKKYQFTREGVSAATFDAILEAATHTRPDVLQSIKVAREIEEGLAEGARVCVHGAQDIEAKSAGDANICSPTNNHARATYKKKCEPGNVQISESNHARATRVLDQIIENARIAHEDCVPICQDTGTVWVLLEVGRDVCSESSFGDAGSDAPEQIDRGNTSRNASSHPLAIPADIFDDVNNAVTRAYEQGKLRMSVLQDALLDRTNTKTNTPAFTEIKVVPGDKIKLHIMLKGGGSDNASRVIMLPPSAGRAGIKQEILKCVREKAANACPPLVIGVGIGATFDKVAGLAKHALLRPVDAGVFAQSVGAHLNIAQSSESHFNNARSVEASANSATKPQTSSDLAAFEFELLEAVNATGIGPAALGGATTALAVHIETAPCHIAALPLAINMGCCAMRSASVELVL